MTTITVDAAAGTMCSDSHWNDGAEKGPMRKVWRINGALVGFSGNLDAIEATKAHLEKLLHAPDAKRPQPPTKANAIALILDGRQAFVWTRTDGMTPVPGRYAIGTGGAAARAALEAGVSASRALAIARNIDATTSGRTRVYKLNTS